MKKPCKYCHNKFTKKELNPHIQKHLNHIQIVKNFKRTTFKCVDDCKRPCCKIFPVLLSAGDMIRISRFLDISIENFVTKYCRFSVVELGIDGSIVECGFHLKDPCMFLKENLCKIYEVRPINCRLFPENQFLFSTLKVVIPEIEDKIMENRENPEVLCFKKDFVMDKSELEYYKSLMHIETIEHQRTKNQLRIQNEELFNVLTEAVLKAKVVDEGGNLIKNPTIDQVMRFSNIADDLWKGLKDYFLDIVKNFEKQENICLI